MHDEGQYLAIDIGNQRGKAVLFEGAVIRERMVFASSDPSPLVSRMKEWPEIPPVAISMVSRPGDPLLPFLEQNTRLLQVNGRTNVPLAIGYHTPDTLGADRLAAACGAFSRFPDRNLLVIDAGTCITIDIVDESGTFLGGSISPGLAMRARAMHSFTERLPLVDATSDYSLVGKDTQTSLGSGALMGIVTEIEGRINRLNNDFPGLLVVMTGGDVLTLCKKINFNIFVMPDLVCWGLRAILLHHEIIQN